MSFVGSPDLITQNQAPSGELKTIQPQLEPLIRNLETALRIDQERYEILDAYYSGQHPHSFDSIRFQQAFGKQLARFADNWMRMSIKVTSDRLIVQGFRVGSGGDTDAADDAAWRVWQANRLDAGSQMAHREAMKYGTCFLLVDPFEKDGSRAKFPRITVESPLQVVGQRDAQNRYRLLNAIKKWIGDDDHLYLNLYLPEVVYKYRSAQPAVASVPNDPGRITQTVNWVQNGEVENPLGEVPLVPMENCPDLMLGGHSDLEDLIPLNDGLNKVLRDMLVTSEYQAFQQRIITGVDLPKDPVTGKPVTEQQVQLMASRTRAWLFPNPDAKVQSLPQVDLTPYTSAVDLFIHHLSSLSQTPSYLLTGKLANLSADAIRASELGFVGKLKTKQIDFGIAWEQAIGLAFKALEDSNADEVIETLWIAAEANSGAVLANELVQAQAFGVPQKVLWSRWGASPQDIERWSKMEPPPVPKPPALAPSSASQESHALHPENTADGTASNFTPDA